MNYGERLKKYRLHAHLTQKELAEKLNVTNSVISRWESGDRRLDVDRLGDLALALDITVNDLIGFDTDFSLDEEEEQILKIFRSLGPNNKNIFKTIGEGLASLEKFNPLEKAIERTRFYISRPVFDLPASAGHGSFLDSDSYEEVEFPENQVPSESSFAVRVSGDSMEPEYPNGSIVFVKQSQNLKPGDIGIFVVNNEGFIKKLGAENNLISLNPKYKDIHVGNYDTCRIVGKVVGVFTDEEGK